MQAREVVGIAVVAVVIAAEDVVVGMAAVAVVIAAEEVVGMAAEAVVMAANAITEAEATAKWWWQGGRDRGRGDHAITARRPGMAAVMPIANAEAFGPMFIRRPEWPRPEFARPEWPRPEFARPSNPGGVPEPSRRRRTGGRRIRW